MGCWKIVGGEVMFNDYLELQKCHNPNTLTWCLVFWVGWRRFQLTGYWFESFPGSRKLGKVK